MANNDAYSLLNINLLDETEQLDVGLSGEQALDVALDLGAYTVGDQVHYDSTSHWNAQVQLIAKKGHIYVYSDYTEIGGKPVAGFKVGDGTTYLIDLPFASGNTTLLTNHVNNNVVHITDEEREFWNNKVTCFVSAVDTDHLIFTKESEENYNG
jgi:hypothetical protein